MEVYRDRLNWIKQSHSFERWTHKQNRGLAEYLEAAVDNLIEELDRIREQGPLAEKLAAFEKAVVLLNKLNKQSHHSLIETGEREELVELFHGIANCAGIDCAAFECNDITLAWRDW